MPTPTEIQTIAFVSQYWASDDITKGGIFGRRTNPEIANMIYLIRKPVAYRYAMEGIDQGNTPSDSLVNTCNYLYQMCGQYGLSALAFINAGGVIPSQGGTVIYSYPISGTVTATYDGQTVFNVSLPGGAIMVQVTKSIQPLDPSEWSYVDPSLTLLGGIAASYLERISYLYVIPITL